jgi:hypothetical protein
MVTMSSLTFPAGGAASRRSLAVDLEQRRLMHRAARIRRALIALRRIADGRSGGAPAPLLHGIRDFRHELAEVEQRLRDLQAPAARLH